jgi:hypothetical protein
MTQETKSPAEQMDVREALAGKIDEILSEGLIPVLTVSEFKACSAALRQPAVSAGALRAVIAKIIEKNAEIETPWEGPSLTNAYKLADLILAALPPSNPPGAEPTPVVQRWTGDTVLPLSELARRLSWVMVQIEGSQFGLPRASMEVMSQACETIRALAVGAQEGKCP